MLRSRVAVALSVSQTLPSGLFILRAISRRSLLAIKISCSLHQLDLARLPGLAEPRFERAIMTQPLREESASRCWLFRRARWGRKMRSGRYTAAHMQIFWRCR